MPKTYVDVFDVIDDTKLTKGFEAYPAMEQEMKTLLRQAGFTLHGEFWTSEGDSFGPLSRSIHATSPENERVTLIYG